MLKIIGQCDVNLINITFFSLTPLFRYVMVVEICGKPITGHMSVTL
jgi:hypothetical protein